MNSKMVQERHENGLRVLLFMSELNYGSSKPVSAEILVSNIPDFVRLFAWIRSILMISCEIGGRVFHDSTEKSKAEVVNI